ncbi:MAG: diguanylate cyclase [Acidobacteria bacterium]|nr:diguanylate cyclase [Acidobacteriota bacterium]
MNSRARLLPLAAGVASLTLGVVCVVVDEPLLGVLAGICGGLAAFLAIGAVADASSRDERLSASRMQVAELEDVVADQVQARLSAEDAVASLGDQLARAEQTPSARVQAELDMDGSILDAETGLFNEHYFSVSAHTRIAAARRHLRPVSIVLLQLVKSIETPYESSADPLTVTDSIRATLRDSDTACRLEDGRFALLLEDTPETGAVWTVERFRRHLSARCEDVTMWAGVACYPAHAFDRDRLLEQAAGALDSAKDWRQDRIEIAVVD